MVSWLRKDWGIKLISLGLAVGLWFYAMGEEGVEFSRVIPLRIEVANESMTLSSVSTTTVKVTFSAPRSIIADIADKKAYAFHQFEEDVAKAGEYSFRLDASKIKKPSFQMKVLRVEPEMIDVRLDELITQRLPIQPNFLGEPAFGYKIQEEEIQLDPNAVLIQGPRDVLEDMAEVETEPIVLIGRIRSFRRSVNLALPSTLKALSEANVDIVIPIREEFTEKDFSGIAVRVLRPSGVSGSVDLQPENVSFTLKGSRTKLEKLNEILTYIDLTEYSPGTHEVEVLLQLPDEVSLKGDEPVKVKAVIHPESSS